MSGDESVGDSLPTSSPKGTDTFAGSSDVDVDVQIRAEERHFVCPIGRKISYRRAEFVVHYRTHTGKKHCSCDMCERECATKGGLNTHRRSHIGDNPYSCVMCDKTCATKGDHNKHRRTHAGEKPYSCVMGKENCATNSGLNRNLINVQFVEKPSRTPVIATHITGMFIMNS
ncbi:Zinc finger protein 18 [Araneus ventricosus]|uniref:Zinc finger protein 18 n=1 Tax=Araneus ventricosus TaxID=182803 RepID=A0A4Y2QEL5_ARAVE|nr:Zinc finger protein 18 [Araneus ventricosus]